MAHRRNERVYSGEGNFCDFDLLGDLDFNARSPVVPTPDAMVAALDASTQARRGGAAPALPGNAGESRVERKRLTEKARRAEMNERLDELAQVLDEVEIPKSTGRSGGNKRKKCGGGSDGPCCEGENASCAVESGNREGHRVLLLGRAIEQLKALRSAYDERATDVVRLALQQQLLEASSMSSTGAGKQPGKPSSEPASQLSPPSSSSATAENALPMAMGQLQQGPSGTTPMMMLMPVWVPAGCTAVAPQVVPMSAEMMGFFGSNKPPQPPPPAAHDHHDHDHGVCPSGKEPDSCDCGPCSSTHPKDVAMV